MNPYTFSQIKKIKNKYLLKKNMTNFKAIFFIWQWLTKYIFSSINKNPKLLNLF